MCRVRISKHRRFLSRLYYSPFSSDDQKVEERYVYVQDVRMCARCVGPEKVALTFFRRPFCATNCTARTAAYHSHENIPTTRPSLYSRLFPFPASPRGRCADHVHSVENMELSGFEQLCRNYSAEKIRGKILQGEVDTGSGCEKRSGQKRMWVHEAVALAKRSREILAMFEGESGATTADCRPP